MINQIDNGYILQIWNNKDNELCCLLHNRVMGIFVPNEALLFLNDFKYLMKYLNNNYILILSKKDRKYNAIIFGNGSYNFDDWSDLNNNKIITSVEHSYIDYIWYMLNNNLKDREELKGKLKVLKGGKKI